LVPSAEAVLELLPPWNRPDALRGLEGFSHIWILFLFHRAMGSGRRTTVRPPRLGGNRRTGVFAARSPFRPNPVGLSAVELRGIEQQCDRLVIHLGGADILDRTPVLDIKPYLPYADCLPEASGGYAADRPAGSGTVHFSETAEARLLQLSPERRTQVRRLIRQVLALDPRPAYLEGNRDRCDFGTRLLEFEVRWRVLADGVVVLSIEPLP
jgi:tRNA-Thr(GGU) m(6)t(6)A37 methyltransferase TsaA